MESSTLPTETNGSHVLPDGEVLSLVMKSQFVLAPEDFDKVAHHRRLEGEFQQTREAWAVELRKLVQVGRQQLSEGIVFLTDAERVVEDVRLRLVALLADISPDDLRTPDPIHESISTRVEDIVKRVRKELEVLDELCAVERSAEAESLTSFYDHEQALFEDYRRYVDARPFSECLKNWTIGYSTNRVKRWREYLSSAGILVVKKFDNGRQQRMKWDSLQRRFLKHYRDFEDDDRLFCHDGKRLPTPPAGKRQDKEGPPTFEVDYWSCDRSFHVHRELDIKPQDPTMYGDHALPAWATEFDRYFCPMWEDCGGVLVPIRKTSADSPF